MISQYFSIILYLKSNFININRFYFNFRYISKIFWNFLESIFWNQSKKKNNYINLIVLCNIGNFLIHTFNHVKIYAKMDRNN